jgi:hypothetical protein
MRVSKSAARTFGVVLTTIVMGGCAGTSQINPNGASVPGQARDRAQKALSRQPATMASFMDSKAVGKPMVFVSNVDAENVNIYLQGGTNKLVGQITGLSNPYEISTDKAANLYVANENSPYLQIYAPPYTGTPTTLDDANYEPSQVGVAPDGTIGIANYCLETSCGGGTSSVVFFAPHSTTPCAIVPAAPEVNFLLFGSFDRHGNFFTDGLTKAKTTILGEITGGCKAKKMSVLTVDNSFGIQGGIHANNLDQIVVLDTAPPGNAPPTVFTYGQPIKHDLGMPVSSTVLQDMPRTDVTDDFAFQANGKNIFVPDSTDGTANEYAYPAGGMPERTIHVSHLVYVSGVAVTPPLMP